MARRPCSAPFLCGVSSLIPSSHCHFVPLCLCASPLCAFLRIQNLCSCSAALAQRPISRLRTMLSRRARTELNVQIPASFWRFSARDRMECTFRRMDASSIGFPPFFFPLSFRHYVAGVCPPLWATHPRLSGDAQCEGTFSHRVPRRSFTMVYYVTSLVNMSMSVFSCGVDPTTARGRAIAVLH